MVSEVITAASATAAALTPARRVEPNPTCRQIRDPSVWDHLHALEEFARSMPVETQTVPFLLLVALGTVTLLNPRVRVIIVGLAVVAGLVSSAQNVTTQRTQANAVAAAINAQAKLMRSIDDGIIGALAELAVHLDEVIARGFHLIDDGHPFLSCCNYPHKGISGR